MMKHGKMTAKLYLVIMRHLSGLRKLCAKLKDFLARRLWKMEHIYVQIMYLKCRRSKEREGTK
ncbi:hypothetical protein DWX17_22700 [[Clostridium] innocuum]|nr:hypothetical protein DWX17_22700 [[Clostridium] innocuum]